ncbi:MAG: acetate--CoA ligase family protein [Acidimicrobiia bacterium]
MPTLSEAESKRLLAGFGVPVVPDRVVSDPDGAEAAAAGFDGPVVVKLCGPGIAHKTERGLVRLGVEGGVVRRAAAELLGAVRPEDGPVELLVAPMVSGRRELIAGLHRDDRFGMTVMLGVGGVLAEAVGDVAFRLLPLEPVDAAELIEDLATQALLGPVRGEPAVDRDALAAVVLGLAAAAGAHPEIVAADLNPLVIDGDGRPVAVDALVEVA